MSIKSVAICCLLTLWQEREGVSISEGREEIGIMPLDVVSTLDVVTLLVLYVAKNFFPEVQ